MLIVTYRQGGKSLIQINKFLIQQNHRTQSNHSKLTASSSQVLHSLAVHAPSQDLTISDSSLRRLSSFLDLDSDLGLILGRTNTNKKQLAPRLAQQAQSRRPKNKSRSAKRRRPQPQAWHRLKSTKSKKLSCQGF